MKSICNCISRYFLISSVSLWPQAFCKLYTDVATIILSRAWLNLTSARQAVVYFAALVAKSENLFNAPVIFLITAGVSVIE